MQGVVIKSTGSWYTVLTDAQTIIECRIKGVFRIKGITTTNPIAVGDVVDATGFGDGGVFSGRHRDGTGCVVGAVDGDLNVFALRAVQAGDGQLVGHRVGGFERLYAAVRIAQAVAPHAGGGIEAEVTVGARQAGRRSKLGLTTVRVDHAQGAAG